MHFHKKEFAILLLLLIIFQVSLQGQNKRVISGSVVNAANNEPLAFATVALKKQMIGIVTNEEGKFDLYIPEDLVNDTLFVSYFGYKHAFLDIHEIKGPIVVRLRENAVSLQEVVVRPLLPENYIRMAMRRIKENYPKDPFQTEAYYREKILENKNLIKCDEGIFKTYYPNYIDTIKPQNQLLLFRRAQNTQEVAFMSEERKKEQEKEKKEKEKAEQRKKSGKKEAEKKESKNIDFDLGSSFGGPESILKSGDISKKPEAYLDTLQFKSYRYSFAKSSSYNTNELMVIDFETKGKVNHVREAGKIYIDITSFAIVRLESTGGFIIPVIIKPILFFYGLGIEDPAYEKKSEFQQINGRWYPKNIQNNVDIKLTNRHWFKPNEHSDFEIEQFFTVSKTKTKDPSSVPPAKKFDAKKDMTKQVYNDDGLSWEGVNIIKK
jgi:hypothetical protein